MSDPIDRLNAALEGRYSIERQLGEGGMATVYLADDLKHERKVALKVLKPELAAVVGAARFLAEIKVTANLQHPHILPLFDSGEADGFLFYVMPYVEGETLRDRMDREHQLPVDEAVRMATNVAEALDYAHQTGVIHRDIKPANILLQAGKPVISDFGIALAVGVAGGGRLTETGLSLGTPHYMSPEQATGDLSVGAATDIYALGCVLYEMLVGDPPYTASTPQAILGKIIVGEPTSATKQRASVPLNVDAAISKALEKVPADRFAGAQAFASALADPGFRHGQQPLLEPAGNPRGNVGWLPWLIAAVSVVAAGIGWGSRPGAEGGRPVASFVPVSLATSLVNLRVIVDRFAVSPDGSAIVYISEDPSTGSNRLFLRRLDELEPTPLPGGVDGFSPVISPDGAWVAFFSGLELVKVPIDGSAPPFVLAEVQTGRSATWGTDGRIRFATASGRGPILSVSAEGGPVDTLVFRGDTAAWRAEPIGDDRLLLSLLADRDRLITVRESDGTMRVLTEGMDARLAPSGHLLFTRRAGDGWSLIAAPFDVRRGILSGPETVLAIDVPVGYATPAAGTLAGDVYYLAGSPRTDRRVFLMDRGGREEPAGFEPGSWISVAASPDGRRIAANSWDGARRTIWVSDLTSATRVTFDEDRFGPTWSPDGNQIAFTYFPRNAVGREATSMWWTGADGRGEPEPIGSRMNAYPSGFSPDGTTLYFRHLTGSESGADIRSVDLRSPEHEDRPLLATRADEGLSTPSPDGRWLAYETDASGRSEIRIGRLPGVSDPVQVTVGGGSIVGWRGDGQRFYYRDATTVWEVAVGPAEVSPASRVAAFALPDRTVSADIMPDGERLVVVQGGPMYSELIVRQGVLTR
jgi:serine/threonine-protein kinase